MLFSRKKFLWIIRTIKNYFAHLLLSMGCFLPKCLSRGFSDPRSPHSRASFLADSFPSFQFKTIPSLFPQIPQDSMIYHETLRILTFNVLADAYIGESFSYCDRAYLEFSYRGPQVMRILENLSPDIICLQEVDHYKDFYFPRLSHNYEVFEEKRTGGEDSLIIAFFKKNFIFLKKTVISYDNEVSEELFETSQLQDRFRKGNKALILEIQSSRTKEKYIVVNTHLHWDPKEEDVKLFQMVQLLKYLENRYSRKEKLVICGDFNSLPDSRQIQLLLKEKTQITDFWKKKHRNLKFRSAYSKYRQKNQRSEHPSFTNYTGNFKGVLDYIFYSRKSPLLLKRILKIPKSGELRENIAIPNRKWPSDHLPLLAEFSVEKNCEF